VAVGIPGDVTATAGSGSASVHWTAPSANQPIDGYQVTLNPVNQVKRVAADQTSLTVTGLTNGQAYTFSVAALTSKATGPSATSNTVTPEPLPIQPGTIPTAEVGQDYTLHFSATGGTAPYTWDITGLPAGLSANGDTVGGTPQSSAKTSTVTVTVADSSSPPRTGRVTYGLAVNHPPVAPAITESMRPRNSIGIKFVPPASDPDGDPLSVTGVGAFSPSGCGTTALNQSGVTFTPEAGFVGPCDFDYTVSDGTLGATGTVTVTVNDQAPVAQPLTDTQHMATTINPITDSFNILQQATSPDGFPLTVTQVSAPSPSGSGTVTFNPASATFTPALDFVGTATMTYTISDGTLSTQNTITVTLTDQAPVAPNQEFLYDNPPSVIDLAGASGQRFVDPAAGVEGPASDPDGDPLRLVSLGPISLPRDPGASPSIEVSIDPNSPTSFDLINFSPDCSTEDLIGVATFSYTLSDGAMSATGQISVFPHNC